MVKVKYIKEHNNYDLTLGKIYTAKIYNEKWLLLDNDDKNNTALYRKECFKIID